MLRTFAVLAATLSLTSASLAQSAPDTPPGTIQGAGVQLVVVDVVVRDANGKPVHGLKASDFHLAEGKDSQTLRSFEEHTPVTAPVQTISAGSMLPGTFTNFTPVPPGGALNVLLVDSLNTPVINQAVLHQQLKKFINQAHPGDRIAIFGLTDRLILLQGFTSDIETLKAVIDHKTTAHSSTMLNRPVGDGADSQTLTEQMSDSYTPEFMANMAAFDKLNSDIENTQRLTSTLDAFNSIARYLSSFSGRKNLLWFSAAFPVNPVNQNIFHRTAVLLSRAQIAVYPIDARQLEVDPIWNPADAGATAALAARSARPTADAHANFANARFQDHVSMETLAEATGGKAFYNTNSLTDATREAIDLGSNYYTLTYVPTDRNWNHAYRPIHIDLTSTHDAKLSYRPGYFADPPNRLKPVDSSASASEIEAAAYMQHGALTYDRASMARGAPAPEDVLFKVRVLPASKTPETTLARDNALDPAHPVAGPFHRYNVDYALLPTAITFTSQPNGNHVAQLKFTVFAYDRDGKLLVAVHKNYNLSLKPDLYERFMKAAVQNHMEISVPDSTETYLRIGIEDVPADHFGAVEVPTAAVSRLAPPAAVPATPTH
jgi:VWFA-related protein